MPVILAIRKLGQEDHEFEGSLKQSETPAQKQKQINNSWLLICP
jgi:hypothetical protein